MYALYACDVVRLAVHADQSHYIISNVMGLSYAEPGHRSRLWVYTEWSVHNTSDVIKPVYTHPYSLTSVPYFLLT